MNLSFLGAAGTVTGSRYLIEENGHRILVDCGLFQGYKQLRLRNWAPLQFDPRKLDAVVLTHAHIDHSGYLPLLCRSGFRGRIYCSHATLELCRILLPDSAHLQEEDAKFANRHGFSKHQPALPLYTRKDADDCLERFSAVDLHNPFVVAKGLKAEFSRGGHLLGACTVRISGDTTSVLFSGDLGRPHDPILNAPEPPLPADYLVIESTYGNRRHPVIDPEQELARWLRRASDRGGITVIPTFAVGRAQALLLYIDRLKRKGEIADLPVYLDSPMAVDATLLYAAHRDDHKLSEDDCRRMCRAATLVNTPEQSQALDARREPMILLSASGMASGGRVLHHLKAFVGDPKNLVLLAGFQAPGTRGASMINGAPTVRIHGMEFPVRAEVGQLEASSAHADADELLAWMRRLPKPPRNTFVVHGEPDASEALRYRFDHELKWPVTVPEYRDTYDLDTNTQV
jgi:metallo-beta-lactamase family protein